MRKGTDFLEGWVAGPLTLPYSCYLGEMQIHYKVKTWMGNKSKQGENREIVEGKLKPSYFRKNLGMSIHGIRKDIPEMENALGLNLTFSMGKS